MSRGQKLAPVYPPIRLGERKIATGLFTEGDWTQEAEVDGKRYQVAIRRGQRVRIAFKPRGQNWGYRWAGSVWRVDPKSGEKARVWDGEVAKSTGVRGILLTAGIVHTLDGWCTKFYRAWHSISSAYHARCHPACRDPEDGRFARVEPYTRAHVCQLTCAHPDRRPHQVCKRCGLRDQPAQKRQETSP